MASSKRVHYPIEMGSKRKSGPMAWSSGERLVLALFAIACLWFAVRWALL
jgi:hypothetical protein